MSINAEPSVYAIRADFRRISRGSLLHRVWHAVGRLRERAADRAAARAVRGLAHPRRGDDFPLSGHTD